MNKALMTVAEAQAQLAKRQRNFAEAGNSADRKRTEKPLKNAERRLADAHKLRDDRMEYLIRIGRDSDERIAALIGVAVGLVHQARNRMAGKLGRSAGAP